MASSTASRLRQGPPPADHLGLEEPDHGLGQRVVERVPDRAHRGRDARLGQALGVPDGQARTTRGPSVRRAPRPSRAGAGGSPARGRRARGPPWRCGRPARPAMRRAQASMSEPRPPSARGRWRARRGRSPGPGGEVGEVAHPEPVRRGRVELPPHAVQRARRGRVLDRRPHGLPSHRPAQPRGPHQPLHRASRHGKPLAAQLPPDLPRPVRARSSRRAPVRSRGAARRLVGRAPRPGRGRGGTRGGRRSRRRGDRQQPADRLEPVDGAVIVHEGDHVLGRRSSSAIAKHAEAFLRISSACRSSRTSRSSSLIRAFSSLVGPARTPSSEVARGIWTGALSG